MPVLEDGLSDSENISGDEQPSSSTKVKTNGRHQSTQSDFIFDPNHSSLITSSHKQQFSKSASTTNGVESQSKSFYIRPPPTTPVVQSASQTNRSTVSSTSTNETIQEQQKASSEETSSVQTGKMNVPYLSFLCSSFYYTNIIKRNTNIEKTLDEGTTTIVKPLPKKGLCRMLNLLIFYYFPPILF